MSDEQKGSLLGWLFKKVLLLAVIAFVVLTFVFKEKSGQWPWEDWQAFASFSKEKGQVVKEKAKLSWSKAREHLAKVDWKALGQETKDKASTLWAKAEKFLESEKAQAAPAAHAEPGKTDPTPVAPAAEDAQTQAFRHGMDTMREGLDLYRQAQKNDDQKAWAAAYQKLQDAREQLEAVKSKAKNPEELDSLLVEIDTHIHHVVKQMNADF